MIRDLYLLVLALEAVNICIHWCVLSSQGVHVAPLHPVRCGWLHAVAAGMLTCIRLLPRHHVLLHLLFFPCRPGALRQAGWAPTPRQSGTTDQQSALCDPHCNHVN